MYNRLEPCHLVGGPIFLRETLKPLFLWGGVSMLSMPLLFIFTFVWGGDHDIYIFWVAVWLLTREVQQRGLMHWHTSHILDVSTNTSILNVFTFFYSCLLLFRH